MKFTIKKAVQQAKPIQNIIFSSKVHNQKTNQQVKVKAIG